MGNLCPCTRAKARDEARELYMSREFNLYRSVLRAVDETLDTPPEREIDVTVLYSADDAGCCEAPTPGGVTDQKRDNVDSDGTEASSRLCECPWLRRFALLPSCMKGTKAELADAQQRVLEEHEARNRMESFIAMGEPDRTVSSDATASTAKPSTSTGANEPFTNITDGSLQAPHGVDRPDMDVSFETSRRAADDDEADGMGSRLGTDDNPFNREVSWVSPTISPGAAPVQASTAESPTPLTLPTGPSSNGATFATASFADNSSHATSGGMNAMPTNSSSLASPAPGTAVAAPGSTPAPVSAFASRDRQQQQLGPEATPPAAQDTADAGLTPPSAPQHQQQLSGATDAPMPTLQVEDSKGVVDMPPAQSSGFATNDTGSTAAPPPPLRVRFPPEIEAVPAEEVRHIPLGRLWRLRKQAQAATSRSPLLLAAKARNNGTPSSSTSSAEGTPASTGEGAKRHSSFEDGAGSSSSPPALSGCFSSPQSSSESTASGSPPPSSAASRASPPLRRTAGASAGSPNTRRPAPIVKPATPQSQSPQPGTSPASRSPASTTSFTSFHAGRTPHLSVMGTGFAMPY